MVSRVFMICDAYESGVGKGIENHASAKSLLAEAFVGEFREAFCLGFDKGQKSPAPAGSVRAHEEQLSPLMPGEVSLG